MADKPITVGDIIGQLEEALVEFGTYSFDDKGPHEVMDLDPITKRLKELEADDAGYILKEVIARHERGQILVTSIVNSLDDQPDDWFDKVNEMTGGTY